MADETTNNNTETTESEKLNLYLDFESITPWNGKNDTGLDVRLKLDRNWKRVVDAFNYILQSDIFNAKYLRKDMDDRSVGTIASDKGFEAGEFVQEATGAACWQDEDGNWHIETDHLRVRKKAVFTEIEVQEVHHVGGQIMLTAANMIVDYVYEMTDRYRCYFRKVDGDGREVENLWQTGDQAYCNTFNLTKQADGTLGNHYFWRLVVGTNLDTADDATERTFDGVTIRTADYNFTDLSKTNCASLSDAPLASDEIVSLGYQPDDDPNRQNAIIIAGAGSGSPYIYEFTGINSFALPEPETRIKPGDNFFTGKFVSKATGLDFDEEFEKIRVDWDKVLEQTDKEFTMWFYDYDPTLENYPASDWVTDEYKALHDQDLFYNTETGIAYRFELIDGSYGWGVVTDLETIKALEKASKAQDTADSKRRNFAAQPIPPYDVGDRWSNATYGELYSNDDLVCVVSKAEGDSFSIDDWQPADCMNSETKKTFETRFVQNEQQISAIASRFDEEGHLIEGSGWVLRSDFVSLFSTQVDEQGLAKTASLSAYVAKDELGGLVSTIEISADQIDLTGQVSFSDFTNSVQTTINDKASQSYVTDTVSDLISSYRLGELDSLAFQNAVDFDQLGSTIVSGDHIITGLINVDELVVNQLSATHAYDTVLSLDGSGLRMIGVDDDYLCRLIATSKYKAALLFNDPETLAYSILDADSLTIRSYDGSQILLQPHNISLTGASISGFALGTVEQSSYIHSGTDFIKATGNVSLPSATGCKGKVIFVKMKGNYTVSSSSTIYKSDSNSTYTSESFNNRSLFFISDGSAWYEFTCYTR